MGFLNRSPLAPVDKQEVDGLATEWRALVEADSPRLSRYSTYREENNWARSADILGQVADTADYGNQRRLSQPQRHNIPLPFGKALNIKHAHRISGRLPDAVVDRREESVEERYRSDTMEKVVWAIIRASGEKTLFKDGAWDGSEIGATCFDLYLDTNLQLPIVRAIDPAGVVVVPGLSDPHDFERAYRSWEVPLATAIAQYGAAVFRGVNVRELLMTLTEKNVTIVQVADRKRTIRFVVSREKGADAVPVWEKEHDLGFVPYVVIPNIGPERDIWGWADYELVRGLVHYIPTLFSREADIIRAVAGGAYQEDGTGATPAKIAEIIRKGGILPTKRGSVVKPIDPPTVPDFESDHAARAIEFLKDLGFAPDAAWGKGSAGSGSDRGLQLQPMFELTQHKQTNWSSGLTRLFRMALMMMEKKMAGPAMLYGSQMKGNSRKPFVFGPIGPDAEPLYANRQGALVKPKPSELADPAFGVEDEDLAVLPRTPKELFQGDYTVRFEWSNRMDPDDPAFVASELNKFQQGVQSARTTMERLGIINPEDELKLIEQEAEKYPWMRQGLIAMLKEAMKEGAQGEGGGAPVDQAGAMMGGLEGIAGADTSATDADFLGGGAGGSLRGGRGTPYGAA